MKVLRIVPGVMCLLLLTTGSLHASIFVGFNLDANTTAYIEYDTSTFSFVGTPTTTSNLGGAGGPITGMAFDANGHLNIAVESQPGFSEFETWDVSTGTLLGDSFPIIGVSGLARDPTGRLFFGQDQGSFTGYAEYLPSFENFIGSVRTNRAGGATGRIIAMAFDSNGNLNIGIEADFGLSAIETWDVSTGTLLGRSSLIRGLAALTPQPSATVIPEPVPEPSSLALLSLGAIGMCVSAGRRSRTSA